MARVTRPRIGSGVELRLRCADRVGSSDTSADAQPQAATSTGKRIDPYYLYLKLPKEDSEHFIVITPFVPVSSNNTLTRLVSFLTANSDPGHYGELRAFTMPQGETVKGPVQVNSEMNRAGAISTAITFLNQQGSRVTQGSLQLIPVGNSLLYVRPFYVAGHAAAAASRSSSSWSSSRRTSGRQSAPRT